VITDLGMETSTGVSSDNSTISALQTQNGVLQEKVKQLEVLIHSIPTQVVSVSSPDGYKEKFDKLEFDFKNSTILIKQLEDLNKEKDTLIEDLKKNVKCLSDEEVNSEKVIQELSTKTTQVSSILGMITKVSFPKLESGQQIFIKFSDFSSIVAPVVECDGNTVKVLVHPEFGLAIKSEWVKELIIKNSENK